MNPSIASVTAHAFEPVLKVIHLSVKPSFAVRGRVAEPVVALLRLRLAPGKDDLRRVAYLHIAAGAHMEGAQCIHKELCEQHESTLDYSVEGKRWIGDFSTWTLLTDHVCSTGLQFIIGSVLGEKAAAVIHKKGLSCNPLVPLPLCTSSKRAGFCH